MFNGTTFIFEGPQLVTNLGINELDTCENAYPMLMGIPNYNCLWCKDKEIKKIYICIDAAYNKHFMNAHIMLPFPHGSTTTQSKVSNVMICILSSIWKYSIVSSTFPKLFLWLVWGPIWEKVQKYKETSLEL